MLILPVGCCGESSWLPQLFFGSHGFGSHGQQVAVWGGPHGSHQGLPPCRLLGCMNWCIPIIPMGSPDLEFGVTVASAAHFTASC